MRRTDVIKLIAEIIEDNGYESYLTASQEAEKILDALHKIGMLPPRRNADQKSSYGYAKVYAWEAE